MKKSKILLSTLLAIVLCVSLIVGATLAMFISEGKTDISVTSGRVDVVATAEIAEAWTAEGNDTSDYTRKYNATPIDDGYKFANNGTAVFTSDKITGTKLTVNDLTPGDGLRLRIDITNNSNVKVKYRVEITNSELNDALFNALTFTYELNDSNVQRAFNGRNPLFSNWMYFDNLGAESNKQSTVDVEIELPVDAGDEYQGLSSSFVVTVFATQINAHVEDPVSPTVKASTTVSDYAEAEQWEAGKQYDKIELDDVVTLSTNTVQNQNGTYNQGERSWDLYQEAEATLTISALWGYEILSFTITYSTGDSNGVFKAERSAILSDGADTYALTRSDADADYEYEIESEQTYYVSDLNRTSITLVVSGKVSITDVQVVYRSVQIWTECEHEWSEWETTEPTCTEPGEKSHTCSICRETETEVIAAKGHDFENFGESKPTCTESGHTAYKQCKVCGHREGYKELEATGHDLGDWTKRNAGLDNEEHYKACSECDYEETHDASYGEFENVNSSEYHEATCDCGLTKQGEHHMGKWTSVNDGTNHARTCIDGCGYSETDKCEPKAEWKIDEETGKHYQECKVCSQHINVHDAEWKVGNEDIVWNWTGYESATATFTCATCGTTHEKEAKITSKTTPATCTDNGSITYTATVELNGTAYTDTKKTAGDNATGHNWQLTAGWEEDSHWNKEGTPDVTISIACSKCEATHTFTADEIKVTENAKTSATCGEDGEVTFHFVATYDEKDFEGDSGKYTLSATGAHTYGDWLYTDNGHYKHCSVCQKDSETQSHTYDLEKHNGDDTGHWEVCDICGYDNKSTLTGHTVAEDGWSHVDSTTQHQGECTVCGETVTEDCDYEENYTSTDATGHWQQCDKCGAKYEQQKHNWDEGSWAWAQDYSSATLTLTCQDCTYVHKVENVASTSSVTSADCETPEYTVYTVKTTVDGNEYTESTDPIKTKDALGHKYEATFTWSYDFDDETLVGTTTVKGTINCTVCSNDEHELKTITSVTEKAESRIPATCENAGSVVYTVVGSYDNKDYNGELTFILKALSHNFDSENWKSDETGHWRECKNGCGIKTEQFAPHTDLVWKHNDDNTQHWQECAVCGRIDGPKKGCSLVWTYDDAGHHWQKCADEACTFATDKQSHGEMDHTNKDPATCKSTGTEEYWYCSTCGAYFEDVEGKIAIGNAYALDGWLKNGKGLLAIDPTNHEGELEYTAQKEAKCNEDGYREYWYCNNCNQYFSDVAGKNWIGDEAKLAEWKTTGDGRLHDETAHKLKSVEQQNPTCEDVGYRAHLECEYCEKWFETTDQSGRTPVESSEFEIKANDHTPGNWQKRNEGLDNEEHYRTCTVCDSEIEKHTAAWGDWTDVNNATYHEATCDCGLTKQGEHHMSDWTSANDGVNHTKTCTDGCGYTETGTCEPKDEWKIDEETGKHYQECQVCSQHINAHSAEWKVGQGDIEWYWTGYESARATFTCATCSTTTTEHATVSHGENSATCGKAGEIVHTATVSFNGETYTNKRQQPTKATGEHSSKTWVHDSEAGEHYKKCDVCGATFDRATYTLTQNEEWKEKAPGCESDGHKAYWYCETCNKYFSDAEGKNLIDNLDNWLKDASKNGGLLEKLGHTPSEWKEDETTKEHYRTCTVCDSKIETHTAVWGKWKDVNNATYHEATCDCGLTKQGEHHMSEWDIQDSTHAAKCSVCGYVDETTRADHEFAWKNVGEHKHEGKCECGKTIKDEVCSSTGEYISDGATGHHQICDKCHEALEPVAHRWSTSKEENCLDKCGAERTPLDIFHKLNGYGEPDTNAPFDWDLGDDSFIRYAWEIVAPSDNTPAKYWKGVWIYIYDVTGLDAQDFVPSGEPFATYLIEERGSVSWTDINAVITAAWKNLPENERQMGYTFAFAMCVTPNTAGLKAGYTDSLLNFAGVDYEHKTGERQTKPYNMVQKITNSIIDNGIWPDYPYNFSLGNITEEWLKQFNGLVDGYVLDVDNATDYVEILIETYSKSNPSQLYFSVRAPFEWCGYSFEALTKAWLREYFSKDDAVDAILNFEIKLSIVLKEKVGNEDNKLIRYFEPSDKVLAQASNNGHDFQTYEFRKIDITVPSDIQLNFTPSDGECFEFLRAGSHNGAIFDIGIDYVAVKWTKGNDSYIGYFIPNGSGAKAQLLMYTDLGKTKGALDCGTVDNGWCKVADFNTWVRDKYGIKDFNAKEWKFSTWAQRNDEYYLFDGKWSESTNWCEDTQSHTYGAPTWTWAQDNLSATATFTCDYCVDELHVTATAGYSVKTQPTCTTEGKGIYTATVTVEFGDKTYTATKEVTIGALGHTYALATNAWTWTVNEQGVAIATLHLVCTNNDCGNTVSVSKQGSVDSTTEATCIADKVSKYSVSISVEEIKAQIQAEKYTLSVTEAQSATHEHTFVGTKENAAHDFTGDWINDGNGRHYQECSRDSEHHSESEQHSSNTWLKDSSTGTHYKKCEACGAKFDRAAHNYGPDDNGNKHACTQCGDWCYTDDILTEIIDAATYEVGDITSGQGTSESVTFGQSIIIAFNQGTASTPSRWYMLTSQNVDQYVQLRVYKGSSFTITAGDNYITKIVFNFGGSRAISAESGNFTNGKTGVWTGEESNGVTFSVTGQTYIESITIYYTASAGTHVWDTKIRTEDANCAHGQLTITACTRCGYTEVVDDGNKTAVHNNIKGHQDEVPATCTKSGNIEYWTCEDCGQNFKDSAGAQPVDDIETPALGHNYVGPYVHDEANPGKHYQWCERAEKCGTHSALEGCKYDNWTDNQDGTHTGTCTECGGTTTHDAVFSGDYTMVDGQSHSQKCADALCDIVETSAHTLAYENIGDDYNHRAYCTAEGCDYEAEIDHDFGNETDGRHNCECGELLCGAEENMVITKDNFVGGGYPSVNEAQNLQDTAEALYKFTDYKFKYQDLYNNGKIQGNTNNANGKTRAPKIWNEIALPGGITSVTIVWDSSSSGKSLLVRFGTSFGIYNDSDNQTIAYASGANGVTITLDASKGYKFIEITESSTGVMYITSITITYQVGHHVWEVTDQQEATCLESGHTTYKCIRCGDTYTEWIEPTGQHVLTDWVAGKDATCTEDGVIAHYTCSKCGQYIAEDGNTILDSVTIKGEHDLSWESTESGHKQVCSKCDYSEPEQGHTSNGWHHDKDGHWYECTVCSKSYSWSEHNFVNDKDCECGEKYVAPKAEGWYLVEDADDLKEGDEIVIVNKDVTQAISTNQANNNRTGTAISENPDGTITPGNDVEILTLGIDSGMFTLYATKSATQGYLYAASSGSNQLKTQSSVTDNSRWNITISGGVASIVAAKSSNRNVMQFNPNGGSPIFACYASASQTGLKIYKKIDGSTGSETPTECTHTNVKKHDRQEPTCVATGVEAYWECKDCNKLFSNEELTIVIESPKTIAATGIHTYHNNPDYKYTEGSLVHTAKCDMCRDPIEHNTIFTYDDEKDPTHHYMSCKDCKFEGNDEHEYNQDGDKCVCDKTKPSTGTDPVEPKFVKVTENLQDWSGTYLIVSEEKYAFNGSLGATDIVNTKSYFEGEFSSDVIDWSEALNKITFTITKSGSGYTIQAASGVYLNYTAAGNGLTVGTSGAVYSISYNESGKDVDITTSNSAHLRFNSSTSEMRFRFFKNDTYTGQKAIQLYKLEGGTTTPGEGESGGNQGGGEDNQTYSINWVVGTWAEQKSWVNQKSYTDPIVMDHVTITMTKKGSNNTGYYSSTTPSGGSWRPYNGDTLEIKVDDNYELYSITLKFANAGFSSLALNKSGEKQLVSGSSITLTASGTVHIQQITVEYVAK